MTTLQTIPIEQLHESPLNPRKRFDPAKLQELADSLNASGQLEALLVRPMKANGGYEIAAGHRRYRAAKLAGLGQLEAKVREIDDRTLVEILTISNLQRDDLHPLEEAQGFRDLMEKAGYDVAKIAARVGRSTKYVYDRVKLLQLVPEAKKLFLAGEFEAGHAIILARLSPADQQRALNTDGDDGWRKVGGMFTAEFADAHPDLPAQQRLALEEGVKAVSVREFQTWVDDHVRMPPEAVDTFLFPDTAQQLTRAQEAELKVVHITHDYRVPDAARDEKQRTYGENSWKRADGKQKAKSCEYAVLGVVVAGPGRGDAFMVCVRKDKCKRHWTREQKELERRRKTRAKYASFGSAPDDYAAQEARRQREGEKRDAERKRWEHAHPAILKAVAEQVAAAPAGPTSRLAQRIVDHCTDRRPNMGVPRGRTLEDLIRHAAFQLYADEVGDLAPGYYRHTEALKSVKALGVKPEKIVDQVTPKPEKPPRRKAKK